MPTIVLLTLVAALIVQLSYFYADRKSEQAKRDKKQESSHTDDDFT